MAKPPTDSQENLYQAAIKNFLQPVLIFLNDPEVSEILINGPFEIYIEKKGKLEKTNVQFRDEESLRAAINNIAQSVGRRISDEEPTLDARLPDGSRIHAILPPCARQGPTVSIRKFFETSLSLADYVYTGALSTDLAQFLDVCLFLGKNILVSGGTGSGKTTLLGVLCGRIPKNQRIIIIEDASELKIDHDHVVHLETKMADGLGKGEIGMKELLKSSLRLRPDRIIVGEVRGAEAMDLISAMNTGHKGCLGTVHANSPVDSLVRLEGLAMGSDAKMSIEALRYQISSAIDLILQIARLPDGSRRVTSVCEVSGYKDGIYLVDPIFQMAALKRNSRGQYLGAAEPTGQLPSFIEEIENHGIPFGPEKFARRPDSTG